MSEEKKKAPKKKAAKATKVAEVVEVQAEPAELAQAAAEADAVEVAAAVEVVDSAEAVDAEFAEFEPGSIVADEVPMSMLLDLSLPISIELGRTSMTVQEILRLGRGAVVQLERLAGEPVDVFVGNRRFAEGEVVVLGEHFGVRITQILTSLSADILD